MRAEPMTGKELHERRRALHVTLAQLSELTGISPATISNFETGKYSEMGHIRMWNLEKALVNLEKSGPRPRSTRKQAIAA